MVSTKHLPISAILVAVANGHMFLATPARLTTPAASNGPIAKTGSNFPCQIAPGGTADGPNTDMTVGSSQPLAFMGTTVHGGGSCQISVTYDNPPTASSVFKVIKSFEGGCPAHNQAGNIPGENANYPVPDAYNFTMLDIPDGKAILGWSWLPRTGGVTPIEFYMQCAAITIKGSSANAKSNYAALPDIYVANLAGINDCTSQFADSVYPNPGPQVEKYLGAYSTYALSSCAAHGGAAGTGTYVGGSGGGAGAPATTSAAPVVASTPSPTAGGVFLTVTTPAAAPASSAGAGSGGASGSSAGGLTGACTGTLWNCVGGHSFQQCASGTWSPVMPMAAGTECTPGQSATLDIKASSGKRSVAFEG